LTETIQVAKWLIDLSGEGGHGYKTVVIDSLDWLEKLIWQSVCKEHQKKSIEDFGYGKGYIIASRKWEQFIHMLDACRSRGMNIVLLAHAKVERYSPPDNDPYDRWMPDLHKAVSPMLQEWADEVLFASYQVSTIKRDEGFGQSRTRAIGSGERVLHTCEAPTHQAKRRIELPDTLPLDWREYAKHWPTGSAGGDIGGIVKDGSSKKEKVA
jgi:hypothetical protein